MPGADPGFFKTGGGIFFRLKVCQAAIFILHYETANVVVLLNGKYLSNEWKTTRFFPPLLLLQRAMLWQLLFLEWKTGTFNSIILESKFHSKRVTQIDFHSRKTFKRVKLTPQWKFHSSTSRLQSQEKVDWKGVLRNGAKWSGSELPKWEWNKC